MILNLTQHQATKEQAEAGIVEPCEKKYIQKLLTFNEFPSRELIKKRAKLLAGYAHLWFNRKGVDKYHERKALIGGAPYIMSALENELKKYRIEPLYSFSQRISEEKEIDGKVVKTNVFKHIGFIKVYKIK